MSVMRDRGGTRKVRTVWFKFGRNLADPNNSAARTQSPTGSCQKLGCSSSAGLQWRNAPGLEECSRPAEEWSRFPDRMRRSMMPNGPRYANISKTASGFRELRAHRISIELQGCNCEQLSELH